MSTKNVVVVSSTRADYSYFRLILKKIIKSKKLNLYLLVTGMHLLEKYGKTKDFIEKDNIPVTKDIDMYDKDSSSTTALGEALGKGMINFTNTFNEIKPDILLVLGDRYETLVAAIAASTLLIPIAHIHGGDSVSQGQVDEQIRYAITKFSHIHFPATEKSAERIKLFGEEKWRIHMVGSPSIDHYYHYHENFLNKEEICKKLNLNSTKDIIICIQHPYTIESNQAGNQMEITLRVLKDLNLQTVIIYPNNDSGSDLIINEIKKYEDYPNFKIFKNIKYLYYSSLMKNANLLIGNSSGGFIESPIFKLAVVNIGKRNKGRETAENVIHTPHNYDEILRSVKRGLSAEFKRICQDVKNPYGDGRASDRIVKVLEELEINRKLLVKRLTYQV